MCIDALPELLQQAKQAKQHPSSSFAGLDLAAATPPAPEQAHVAHMSAAGGSQVEAEGHADGSPACTGAGGRACMLARTHSLTGTEGGNSYPAMPGMQPLSER